MLTLALNIAAFIFLAWLSLVAIAIFIRFPGIPALIAVVAMAITYGIP